MKSIFEGKRILVTGGTGSIGSELVRKLLKFNPAVIRVFSNDENQQFLLEQELKEHQHIVRHLIGDVRDRERLARAMEDIDIVFHAAALKHVPLCEYNPLEAVKTNVIGTQNVIEVALDSGTVERVINISTDKAVNPSSTMGATKLLTEKLITWATFYRRRRRPVFASVRFGNVLNTRGSIIPTVRQQIEAGGPVTLTDGGMRRFIMSVSEASDLVLKATEMARGGEIFVLKMPVVKISDLIDVLIDGLAPKYGHDPKSIKIKTIGTRMGERLDECLMSEDEISTSRETESMFIIPPLRQLPQIDAGEYHYPQDRFTALKEYSSRAAEPISKDEILHILKKEKIV